MDEVFRGVDMPKVIANLISLLEEQEKVQVTYTLERLEETA